MTLTSTTATLTTYLEAATAAVEALLAFLAALGATRPTDAPMSPAEGILILQVVATMGYIKADVDTRVPPVVETNRALARLGATAAVTGIS